MSKRGFKTDLPSAKEPLSTPSPLPSLDELIAESRALGMNDVAKAFEHIRYLESPKGQKALERRKKRLSRL